MNRRFYKIFSFILIIAWMFVIFSLSAMEGPESDLKSRFVLSKIIAVFEKIENIAIREKVKTTSTSDIIRTQDKKIERDELAKKANTPFRKCMHATVYFVLALLLFNFVNTLEIKKDCLKYILSLLLAFIYACTDEFHQTFIYGRGGEFRDVLIDTSGAIFALIIIIMISLILKYIKNKKNLRNLSKES